MKRFFYFLFSAVIIFNCLSYSQKKITFDDIYSSGAFRGEFVSGFSWYNDGKNYSYFKTDPSTKIRSLVFIETSTGKEIKSIPLKDFYWKDTTYRISLINYQWSPNNKYLLITGLLPARSAKSGGSFYIYDVNEQKVIAMVGEGEDQSNIHFSPDGNKVAFVRNDNLFYYDILTEQEKQLTFDGNENILNGHFDWVYEEEFSIIRAYEWMPDSKSIAFWRLDQTDVPKISIQKWDSLYLNSLDMRYPKAGAKNSEVKIGVVDISSSKTMWMDIGSEKDIYIPRITPTKNPNILAVQRLNRLQNKNELLLCNVKDGSSKVILTINDDCWVDINDDLHFLTDGSGFLWTNETDGWNHIYHYNMNGKLINQVTKGKWEVASIESIDESKKTIYYMSNERGNIYSDLYSISFDGKNKKRITEEKGTHTVTISPDNNFFYSLYNNSKQMTITSIKNISGKNITTLAEPKMDFWNEYGFVAPEFLNFSTTDGEVLQAMMIKPLEFDASKKYPVLIYNYSGPGSKTVKDQWGVGNFVWSQMLAQNGYIIFMIDNRGTGGRGKAFKNIVYKNLGQWEVNDHIEAAKYLSSLNYVDAERIGIWGWSYGGYISALTLVNAADYFKAAISVAPVTHWKFYDSIYTERYMSLPNLNEEGYEKSSVLANAEKLKGNLLLVHGTADDNVHFQNAVALVAELIKHNKPFQTMYYPEKDHGIYGGNTRRHLYEMMTKFLFNNL